MDNKYAGMTVNERLWVSGLMDEFERAISQKNTDEAVRILTEVELTEENIKPILVKLGLRSELG
jgi:molecular chaperone GrpE (heat shock protein)